ncbi:hypothetical protein BDZ45DRAFT_763049 [Acephala macrosclerotiorum]|nr:hypothetical protein BDZ45DRAFT_763049 [Acephala macrosclerotiorum]
MLWWARFNKSREKKLRGLFQNRRQIKILAAEFDALSKIPGLFDAGMMVTTLHKVMATKCFEEIQHYLEHIRTVWDGLLHGVRDGLQRVDVATVKAVELRAPGISALDAQFLKGIIVSGAVFADFDTQERGIIWENSLRFKGIIPSLYTFFQDIHLLQACVDGIRWLVTIPEDETLFTALQATYCQRETQLVQESETTVHPEAGTSRYCMRLGYLNLIAAAMRRYKDLPRKPVKTDSKEMPRAKADRAVLEQLAFQAKQSGFRSPEIDELEGNLEPPSISDIRESVPIAVTTGPDVDVKRRCGLPHVNSFKVDKNYLFLNHLCRGAEHETREGITSFFVLKSWFFAFFGTWPEGSSTASASRTSLAYDQSMDEVAVDMGARQARTQAESAQGQHIAATAAPQSLSTDFQMQDVVEPGRQNSRMETNPIFIEEGADFGDTSIHDTNDGVWNALPQSAKVVREVRVVRGDPASRIAEQVKDFLDMGRRTCDKNKPYLPAEDCYREAVKEENQNTLFLITDAGILGNGECYVSGEEQAKEGSHDQGESQTLETETEGIECEDITDNQDIEFLDYERENAENSAILDRNTKMIHLKSIHLRMLESGDCYKVAMKADNHTLYLMAPSPQSGEQKAAEHAWKSLLRAEALDFAAPTGERRRRRVPRTTQKEETQRSKQDQETIGFADSAFIPPPGPTLPLTKQITLLRSKENEHRDKIGTMRQRDDTGAMHTKQYGLTFHSDSPRIRKARESVRNMHASEDEAKTKTEVEQLKPGGQKVTASWQQVGAGDDYLCISICAVVVSCSMKLGLAPGVIICGVLAVPYPPTPQFRLAVFVTTAASAA